MAEIAIVTDSTVCLPQDLVQRYGIHIVPLWIHWLREGYRLTTSQGSMGE